MNIRKLKQESAALHHQLSQKNDYKMTDMIMYLRGKDLSNYNIELLRYELLSMAVKAESERRAIETSFGFDLREYVDQRVSEFPAMTKAETTSETFNLWGFAAVVLIGASIAFDWVFDFIAKSYGGPAPDAWTVTFTELFMLLMIIGIAVTLGSLFTTHKLEKDPDFFSKGNRNHFSDFLKLYGLTLIIVIIGFALIFIFRDRLLFTLPLSTAFIGWTIGLVLYLVIRYVLNARLNRNQ